MDSCRYNPMRLVCRLSSGECKAAAAGVASSARGYVLESLVRAEMLDTIRIVHGGQRHVQSDVAAEIATHTADATITAREIEVLKLIARGHANKVISAKLGINEETTKSHIKNILAKLGARDRTHAVTLGLTRGIIRLER
jgi:DNA-binding NarL/FixJ family response regulator